MDANETDEQRLEHIKDWWKENASSVITGLLLGLALLFGGKSWFAYQDRKADEASNIYAGMMNALAYALMWFVSMYQMWIYKLPEHVKRRHLGDPDSTGWSKED